jgi:hypothetical protein
VFPEGRVVRRISDPKSIGILALQVVLLVAVLVSLAWLTDRRAGVPLNGIADAAAPREWIETRGTWIPTTTNDWLERLNGPSSSPGKRSGATLGGGQSQRRYDPPSGVTRVPAIGSNLSGPPLGKTSSGAGGRSSSGAAKSSGAIKKTAASKSKSDDDDGDDASPWTKEESRGTYRTLCVRMCDGYYFPISFATTKDNLARDTKVCERSCKSPARLFFHENPGQEPEEMEDARGKRYKDLKIAFSHQKQYDESCTCKSQPWDEAALARHRQFAEVAERKKGGKKSNDAQSKVSHVSQAKDTPDGAATAAILIPASLTHPSQSLPLPPLRTGHPATVASADLGPHLISPALAALSVKRRQSIAPGRLDSRLKRGAQRSVSFYQTPVGAGRLPRQSRPWTSPGAARIGFVDVVRPARPLPASANSDQTLQNGLPRPKAAGQNTMDGPSLGAKTMQSPVTPSGTGKKLADGAETQVR